MPTEVTVESAPARLRDLFNKGFIALERGNLDYAIDMFLHCIEQEPYFFNARKFLRAAEIKQYKSQNQGVLAAVKGQLSVVPGMLAAQIQARTGKAMMALQTLEKLLRKEPLNLSVLALFGQVAEAADMPEVAVQTLALARDHYPDNVHLLNQLGGLYQKTQQTRLARECYEKVCELRPNDGAALKRLKDAMAIDSMAKDGWAEAVAAGGDYRRVIKDEKEAVILEQESKAVKGAADVDALLDEYRTRVAKEPENINYRRALANLYVTKLMFAEALQTMKEAGDLTGGRDPQIAASVSHIRLQQYDHEIEKLQQAGDAAGAETRRQERDAFAFSDVEERVKRYPNDLQLRYEYGVLLQQRQRINEAIQQFQIAQRSPHYRTRSLYNIGVCFASKRQYDLAIEQFGKAAAELETMDDLKKAVIYELGKALEAMGDHKKALEHFKHIYQVDIAYQDVAARIEKGYQAPPGPTA